MIKPYIGGAHENPFLKALTINFSSEPKIRCSVLVVQSEKKQIIVLSNKSRFLNFSHNITYNPFIPLKFFKAEDVHVPKSSLVEREIGILGTETSKGDEGSIERFWEGDKFIIKNVVYELLKNKFTSTSTIEGGFEFCSEKLVVRGHSKNLQSERTFLNEVKTTAGELLDQFNGCKLVLPKISKNSIQKFLNNIFTELEKLQKSKELVENSLSSKLNDFFLEIENIIDLRLCQDNKDIQKQIEDHKNKVWTQARNLQHEYVNCGFLSNSMDVNFKEIMEALGKLQQLVQKLELFVNGNSNFKKWEYLSRAFCRDIGELANTIDKDQISSAKGWIVRIFCERLIDEVEDAKISLWHTLAELMRAHHNPNVSEEKYLISSEYRKLFLKILKKEIIFDMDYLMPNKEQIKIYFKNYNTLYALDRYWNSFLASDESPIYLNTAKQIEKEIFDHFKRISKDVFGRLLNQLLFPAPRIKKCVQNHLDEVLSLIIEKFKLETEKFKLGDRLIEDKSKINFPEPEYAKIRLIQDPIIYKLTTWVIILLARSSSSFEKITVDIAGMAREFISRQRYYGPQNKRIKFLTVVEDQIIHLKKMTSQLLGIEELLEGGSKKIFRSILSSFEKKSRELESMSEVFNKLLAKREKTAEWWGKCVDLAINLEEKIEELRAETEYFPSFSSDYDKEEFANNKSDFFEVLKNLNASLKKRDPLKRAINSLLPMLDDEEQNDVKMNAKLRRSEIRLNDLLEDLNKGSGFSEYDCAIRDKVVSKIEETKELFTRNTTNEFFMRIGTVRALIDIYPVESELADKIYKCAKIKLLQKEIKKASKMGQSISFAMKQCSWAKNNDMVAHYSWLGSSINEDPNYCSNETHIPLNKL